MNDRYRSFYNALSYDYDNLIELYNMTNNTAFFNQSEKVKVQRDE